MKFSFTHTITDTACLVLGFFSEDDLKSTCAQLDIPFSFHVPQKAGTEIYVQTKNDLLLIHCGKKEKFDGTQLVKITKQAISTLSNIGITQAIFYLPKIEKLKHDLYYHQAALAAETALYELNDLKSKKEKTPACLEHIAFYGEGDSKIFNKVHALNQGMTLCRDLGNLPPNVCTPTYLANTAKTLAKTYSTIKTQVMGESEMKAQNMGALLAVSQGSEEEAKLIEIHYNNGSNDAPIVLVGKGITFDSGGLSLKPPTGMIEMKFDMCGAASVIGTMKALAELQLPLNVVGLVAASENLPSGKAVKPGDIIKSHSGKTIEILNTDAEGRLVLCDALSYAQKFNPQKIIDIATLTGAVIIALGYKTTGLMSNDKTLAEALLKASEHASDKAWQLPLWDEYQELLDSNMADMSNISHDKSAGSIAAACFLSRFVGNTPWAHLDIAGTAWQSGKNKAATGRPVPLLTQFLIEQCQS